jgi:hypothetical protein
MIPAEGGPDTPSFHEVYPYALGIAVIMGLLFAVNAHWDAQDRRERERRRRDAQDRRERERRRR